MAEPPLTSEGGTRDAGPLAGPGPGSSSTRARVIAAAVACILEEGYYRASSNKVAARAGVTWGVIQYHFGSREQLLLAIVKHSADELFATVSGADITGETFEERLTLLADVVWSYYRRPEFLVYMQTALDLAHDPTAAAETVETVRDLSERMATQWEKLARQVVGSMRNPAAVGQSLFDILRGAAIGAQLSETLPGVPAGMRAADDRMRKTLIRALAALLEQQR